MNPIDVVLFCQFTCEGVFGPGATLSHIGMGILLTMFYGFRPTHPQAAQNIDYYSEREAAIDRWQEICTNEVFFRDGLIDYMQPHVEGIEV